MSGEIVEVGPWLKTDLCEQCGYELGDGFCGAREYACPGCGAVGAPFGPDYISTSKRFITTKKKWFGKNEGHWEWSGKSSRGENISGHLMKGRRVLTAPMTIAATGVASGLF